MKKQPVNQQTFVFPSDDAEKKCPLKEWIEEGEREVEETFAFYDYIAEPFKKKFGLNFVNSCIHLYGKKEKKWLRDQKTLFDN